MNCGYLHDLITGLLNCFASKASPFKPSLKKYWNSNSIRKQYLLRIQVHRFSLFDEWANSAKDDQLNL
jgi:hypothetical protein